MRLGLLVGVISQHEERYHPINIFYVKLSVVNK